MKHEYYKKDLYEYDVEGFSDFSEFAKSVLLLTNLKSNQMGIIDFRTFPETNDLRIVTDERNDKYIESHVGKIKEVEKIVGYEIDIEDIRGDFSEEIDKVLDSDKDYKVYFGGLLR